MLNSKVRDSEDGEQFPDPLSASFENTQFTNIPQTHTITAGDISKFWLTMYNHYGLVELDDVLLSLNGVPHISCLEPGDTIYMLDINDIRNFNTQKTAE